MLYKDRCYHMYINGMLNSHTTSKGCILYTVLNKYVHIESIGNVERIEQDKTMKLLYYKPILY